MGALPPFWVTSWICWTILWLKFQTYHFYIQDIFILWKSNLRYEMLLLVTEYVLDTWAFKFLLSHSSVYILCRLPNPPSKKSRGCRYLSNWTELKCFVCIQEYFLYFLHWNFNFLVKSSFWRKDHDNKNQLQELDWTDSHNCAFCYILMLIFKCRRQALKDYDPIMAVIVHTALNALLRWCTMLFMPMSVYQHISPSFLTLYPFALPRPQATGIAPPMTSVTVLLGHLPWHQPMAFSSSAQILELMPVVPRQLLGVVSAWPNLRTIKALLPGVKLSTLLGLFSYTFLSGGRFRGTQISMCSLKKIHRMVEVGRNRWN